MRKPTMYGLLLLVTATTYAAIPPTDFFNFAGSAERLEQNATSSHETLLEIHRHYVVAAAADAALTAESFPEVAASEAGLAAQFHLRDDAVRVLTSYAGLLASLAENAPSATIRARSEELQDDVKLLERDGRDIAATPIEAEVAKSAEQLSREAGGIRGLTPAEVDQKVYSDVKRLEQTLKGLATTKFRIVIDQQEGFALRLLSTGVDEVWRFVEQRKHDEALRTLLRTMQPDIDRLTSFITESTGAMKASKDLMLTKILARANQIRPTYDAPSRLEFDFNQSALLAKNRHLGPLLDSVSAAATHYATAHGELLQVAEKKESSRVALLNFRAEVIHGHRFDRAIQSTLSGIPIRRR